MWTFFLTVNPGSAGTQHKQEERRKKIRQMCNCSFGERHFFPTGRNGTNDSLLNRSFCLVHLCFPPCDERDNTSDPPVFYSFCLRDCCSGLEYPNGPPSLLVKMLKIRLKFCHELNLTTQKNLACCYFSPRYQANTSIRCLNFT